MKKPQVQPNAVQGTAVAKIETKSQTPALIVLPRKEEPSPEELQKKIELLERKIASVPTDLNARIDYYNQKQDWIKKLEKIKAQKGKLVTIQQDVLTDLEADEFLTENFAIGIFRKKQYGSDEEIFKIHNPTLVGVVLKNVLEKMNEKIDELEISIAN